MDGEEWNVDGERRGTEAWSGGMPGEPRCGEPDEAGAARDRRRVDRAFRGGLLPHAGTERAGGARFRAGVGTTDADRRVDRARDGGASAPREHVHEEDGFAPDGWGVDGDHRAVTVAQRGADRDCGGNTVPQRGVTASVFHLILAPPAVKDLRSTALPLKADS